MSDRVRGTFLIRALMSIDRPGVSRIRLLPRSAEGRLYFSECWTGPDNVDAHFTGVRPGLAFPLRTVEEDRAGFQRENNARLECTRLNRYDSSRVPWHCLIVLK